MLSWFKSRFRKNRVISEEEFVALHQRDADDPSYAATFAATEAYWAKIGIIDPDVISYIVNPMFLGSPAWPGGRQAFRVIRTTNSLIIASDGLSDPFEDDKDEQRNGFEMEVFIEAKGKEGIAFDQISSTAEFAVIEQVTRQIANWGGITRLLAEVNVASSDIPISNEAVPDAFITPNQSIGVLFGMMAKGRPKVVPDTPLSPVRMVAVTALTSDELAEVAKNKTARDRVAKALRDAGYGHISDFSRASLV